ncbi:MAG: glycosyltransferase family 9 protein [Flavobacteriaceae bacterium]|nr:glycosyltransferase family 9 protein [Flavobacteriaceae bacterium]
MHRHIAVFRLSALGDVAMLVPVLRALSDQFPNLTITVVSRPFFKPLFDEIPQVHFYSIDLKDRHKGFLGLFRLALDLRSLQIDAFADCHQVLRSLVTAFFLRFLGVQTVVLDKGRLEKKRLTRCKNKVFKPLKTTHERYADVFRRLGFPVVLEHVERAKQPIDDIRSKLNLNRQDFLIGLAPFAKFDSKTYPSDLMRKLLTSLSSLSDVTVILFGAPNERDALSSLYESQSNIINLAALFNFSDELRLISNLDLMLSMDSGNAHLAAMYGKPVVTIWGVTHPHAGFAPFGQPLSRAITVNHDLFPCIPTSVFGKTVPLGYEDCMRSIAPETIFEKVYEIYSQKKTDN